MVNLNQKEFMNKFTIVEKKYIYNLFGFKLKRMKGELNYNNFLDAIDLGDLISSIFVKLDIEDITNAQYIVKKHVLHLIRQNSINYLFDNLEFSNEYSINLDEDHPLNNIFDSVIFSELSHINRMEGKIINIVKPVDDKEKENDGEETLIELNEDSFEEVSDNIIKIFKKKEYMGKIKSTTDGSKYIQREGVAAILFRELELNYKQPFHKRPLKLKASDFDKFVVGLEKLLKSLQDIFEVKIIRSVSQDIFDFHRQNQLSYIIHLMDNVNNCCDTDDISSKIFREMLKGSCLIENIEIKKLMFDKEGFRNLYLTNNLTFGIYIASIYQFQYIFMPFLTEFLSEKLLGLINRKTRNQPVQNTNTNTQEVELRGHLEIIKMLGEQDYYNLDTLNNELSDIKLRGGLYAEEQREPQYREIHNLVYGGIEKGNSLEITKVKKEIIKNIKESYKKLGNYTKLKQTRYIEQILIDNNLNQEFFEWSETFLESIVIDLVKKYEFKPIMEISEYIPE